MITFRQVTKRYGAQEVLTDVNLQVNRGERVAIVGPNGAGKTTIFSLITGEIAPDRGQVILPSGMSIGYVRQQINAHATQVSLLDSTENAVPEFQSLQAEVDELHDSLHDDTEGRADKLQRLGEMQTRFEHLGGYTLSGRLGTDPYSYLCPGRRKEPWICCTESATISTVGVPAGAFHFRDAALFVTCRFDPDLFRP